MDNMAPDFDFDKEVVERKPKNVVREGRVEVTKASPKTVEEQTFILDQRQKNLIKIYKEEPLVPVRVAPSYAKYFGRVMRVSLNGIIVAVKCNGETQQLPKSFATEVLRRMSEMDKHELRAQKMANASANFENSPGQINFFG